MIATAGFGAFPDNPLTTMFQTVIVENFPLELVDAFNLYMDEISAPQIQPRPVSESDEKSQPDPVGALLAVFEENTAATANEPSAMDATKSAIESTQTQIAFIQSLPATWTQTATQTQTTTPSITFTLPPTLTQSATPVWTLAPVYIPPKATSKPKDPPPPTSTFTSITTSTSTSTPSSTPTLVPGNLVLYLGAISDGNIGPRSSADAFCAANLPTGFSNYHAFISYSAADSIANMPVNYGIPNTLPILSATNVLIANNWADLMDGSIAASLSSSGVTPSNDWWSGAENADGTHLDGITTDCNEWTVNNNFSGGNAGLRGSVNSAWMDFGSPAACDQLLAVLCIAY